MAAAVRLILASSSPARQELLRRAGYDFVVFPPEVVEPSGEGVQDPRRYVQEVAWLKAAAVAPRVAEGIVLAADSVAWHQGRIIGKPRDRQDARRILSSLCGSIHELWTGVCLWLRPLDWQISWQERSRLHMKALSAEELSAYLDAGHWEGKSGAYAIQENGDPYLTVLEGTVSNVVGLPMERLTEVLSLAENFLRDKKSPRDLNRASG
jgi:septum formation protein